MAVETQVIEDWLYEQLTQNANLAEQIGNRVYAHQAPQEAVYPLVIIAPQSVTDINTFGQRGTTRALMLIKVVAEGESMPKEIADAVDLAVDGQQETHQGLPLRFRRVQTIEYPETRLGKRYSHLGGIYRCYAG